MNDNDSGFLLAMLFIVWGIPLIFWAISVSFEWATWQLILLGDIAIYLTGHRLWLISVDNRRLNHPMNEINNS